MEELAKVMRTTFKDALPELKELMDKNNKEGRDNINEAFINLKLHTCIDLLDYLIADDKSKTVEELTNDFLKKIFE